MRFFRKSWKYQVTTVIKYLFLILVAIVSLYPFIWVLISSFKDNNSIFGDPFGLPVKIAFEKGYLRGAVLSTRGPGWTGRWCIG